MGTALAVVLGLLTGVAPAAADSPPTDLSEYNLAAVDGHVIPGYRTLAKATGDLASRADAFCQAPDDAGLADLRQGFHAAMDAWQGIRHIQFGPIGRELRTFRFQLFPDKRNIVGRHLGRFLMAADPAALTPERFAQGSAALQGFGALERLLFAGDIAPDTFQGEAGAYRCALAQAIAANLANMAGAVLAEWTEGPDAHRHLVATAAEGNAAYTRDTDVAGLLLNNLHSAVQSVADLELGLPLGESAAKARGRLAEGWRSGRSLRNVRLDLEAARDLYRQAFAPRLAAGGPEAEGLHARIEGAFDAALAAVEDVPPPLREAVADPQTRPRVVALRQRVVALEHLLGGPLPRTLDLSLGFNALDGD